MSCSLVLEKLLFYMVLEDFWSYSCSNSMVFAIFNFHWGDGTSQSAWPLQVSDGTFHFAWYLPAFGHDSFGPSTFISHGARTSWTLSLPFLHGICSIGRLRISFCTVHVTLWDFRLCMIFGTLWSVCFQFLGGTGWYECGWSFTPRPIVLPHRTAHSLIHNCCF